MLYPDHHLNATQIDPLCVCMCVCVLSINPVPLHNPNKGSLGI